MARPLAPATVKPIPEGLPATLRPLGALPAEEAHDRFWNMVAVLVISLIAIAAGGVWAYTQVRQSLKDIRFAGLTSLLESESGAMLIWIDEKKRDAERWASAPDVQRAARAMVDMAHRGIDPAAICASAPRHALMEEIAPYVVLEEAVTFNLTLPDGSIIASNHDSYCGRRIRSQEFMERLAPVFQGRTVFVRPFLERDRVPTVAPPRFEEPLVWVKTPVRDAGGKVVAALGFGRAAEVRFGRLLSISLTQTSRESYAFDRRGLMLTQSRYLGDLRRAGILGVRDSGVVQLELRDPGGDIVAGYRPARGSSPRPFTRLAETAFAARAEGG